MEFNLISSCKFLTSISQWALLLLLKYDPAGFIAALIVSLCLHFKTQLDGRLGEYLWAKATPVVAIVRLGCLAHFYVNKSWYKLLLVTPTRGFQLVTTSCFLLKLLLRADAYVSAAIFTTDYYEVRYITIISISRR